MSELNKTISYISEIKNHLDLIKDLLVKAVLYEYVSIYGFDNVMSDLRKAFAHPDFNNANIPLFLSVMEEIKNDIHSN